MTHFINKSGETIPPYACMQLCIPPKEWDVVKKLPLTEGAKQVILNLGPRLASELPRYDQDSVLYCVKPNRMSALFQEPATIAFNGPSYVAPDKQGVCMVGEYPVKAIGSLLQHPGTAMGIVAGSWRMNLLAAEAGAFRSLYPTDHQLNEQKKDFVTKLDDAAGYVIYVAPNTFRKSRLPLYVDGLVGFKIGDNRLTAKRAYASTISALEAEDFPIFAGLGIPITSPFQGDESLFFDNGVLDAPGYYRIRIRGAFTSNATTTDFENVPVNFRLRYDYESTRDGNYDTELIGAEFNAAIPKYIIQRVPTTVFAWSRMYFEDTCYMLFRGQKGRLVLENRSSPFVIFEPGGFALKFDITRMNFSQIQEQRDTEWGVEFFRELSFSGDYFRQLYYLDAQGRQRVMFYPQPNLPPA